MEKRAFFRLVSGLHASINVHLSARYLLDGESRQRSIQMFTFTYNLHIGGVRYSLLCSTVKRRVLFVIDQITGLRGSGVPTSPSSS